MRLALILALLAALFVSIAAAAPPSTCGGTTDYERALCSYQHRNFGDAEKAFRAIADANEQTPETIRSLYFLARTLMKSGRFDEASQVLIKIYALDKPFYDAWSCDYLLGECRRAAGRE